MRSFRSTLTYWRDRLGGKHDFGNGFPIAARVHSKGGGWVDEHSSVHGDACVDRKSVVYGMGTTIGPHTILCRAKVYGGAKIGAYCRITSIALGAGTVLQDGVILTGSQDTQMRSLQGGRGLLGTIQKWSSYANCSIEGGCVLRGAIVINVPVIIGEQGNDNGGPPLEITSCEFGAYYAQGEPIFIRRGRGAVLSGCRFASGITVEGPLRALDCSILPGVQVQADPGSPWVRGLVFSAYGRYRVTTKGEVVSESM